MSVTMADYTVDLEIDLTRRAADICKLLADCQPDMHEPDEQGVEGFVHGTVLDNALRSDPELMIGLEKNTDKEGSLMSINVADLLAIVRYLNTSREHYHNLYARLQDQCRIAKAHLT